MGSNQSTNRHAAPLDGKKHASGRTREVSVNSPEELMEHAGIFASFADLGERMIVKLHGVHEQDLQRMTDMISQQTGMLAAVPRKDVRIEARHVTKTNVMKGMALGAAIGTVPLLVMGVITVASGPISVMGWVMGGLFFLGSALLGASAGAADREHFLVLNVAANQIEFTKMEAANRA